MNTFLEIFKLAKRSIYALLYSVRAFYVYSRDCLRFLRHSRSLGLSSQSNYEAAIIAHYHVLEKGLTMPSRKHVFGESIAASLYSLVSAYLEKKYVCDTSSAPSSQVKSAIKVLYEYSLATGVNFPLLDTWLDQGYMGEGGGISIKREDYLRQAIGNFADLVTVRRSVRSYEGRPVDLSIIEAAVADAQQSPSVCNRQSSRAYYYYGDQKIKSILALQNGNRGFGHLAAGLFVIVSDLSVFSGLNERNQAWIDSGLFAMSLLYSLTYRGLGACPLNWCVTTETDRSLRKLLGIPSQFSVVMLISVGHLPNKFDLAVSSRRDVSDVLFCIK